MLLLSEQRSSLTVVGQDCTMSNGSLVAQAVGAALGSADARGFDDVVKDARATVLVMIAKLVANLMGAGPSVFL